MRKPVVGFEGVYEVSDTGEVFRVAGSQGAVVGRRLRPSRDKNGYLMVNLSVGNVAKTHKVHRLVAMAFIPNPDNLPQVNHKDCDVTNSCVDNMEWCNNSHNIQHAYRNGRFNASILRQSKPVIGISLYTDEVLEFPSTMAAGRAGFHQGHVAGCARGDKRHGSHKGYKWYFKTECRV